MISFVCHRCGKAVRVPDAHAGKKGRCPACSVIVNIPGGAADNVRALSAAVNGEDPDAHKPVPGPPNKQDSDGDEFPLLDLDTSSTFETDTYPPIRQDDRAEDSPTAAKDSAESDATDGRRFSRMNLVLLILLAIIVVVSAGAAVAISMLL